MQKFTTKKNQEYMYYLPYNVNLKKFSRELRQNATKGEVLLWRALKGNKIHNHTFNRQKPLGRYIVDFYCKKLNLVIEIDGNSHLFHTVAIKDSARQKALKSMKLYLIRFSEAQVRFQLPQVIEMISQTMEGLEKGEIRIE